MPNCDHNLARTAWRCCLGPVVVLAAALPLFQVEPQGAAPLPAGVAGPSQVPDWRSQVAPSILARVGGSATGRDAGIIASERDALTALYGPGQGRALWIDASGSLTRDAHDVLGLLASASDDGLDPGDYGLVALTALAAAVDGPPTPNLGRLAAFDLLLSAATLRYFHHLHLGRIDPRTIGVRLVIEPEATIS
jgi:hypothetical protein